jgi:hypothetical protein
MADAVSSERVSERSARKLVSASCQPINRLTVQVLLLSVFYGPAYTTSYAMRRGRACNVC